MAVVVIVTEEEEEVGTEEDREVDPTEAGRMEAAAGMAGISLS